MPRTKNSGAHFKRLAAIELAKSLKQGRKSLPALSDLCDKILSEFGGTEQFAATIHRTFSDPKTNSIVKARMLSDVLRLLLLNAERNITSVQSADLGGFDDRELESFVAAAIERIAEEQGSRDGEVSDGSQAPQV
jgi:hypothetical protein